VPKAAGGASVVSRFSVSYVYEALETSLDYAMTNSFGFGGTNASLIFRAQAD
jgi:3-oxoacyl-(acyl-carrier-protein) synthase